MYPRDVTKSTFRSGSVSHFRKVMQAFSRSGVDFTVQTPTPRCMTSFSPSSKMGQGSETISTCSVRLSS